MAWRRVVVDGQAPEYHALSVSAFAFSEDGKPLTRWPGSESGTDYATKQECLCHTILMRSRGRLWRGHSALSCTHRLFNSCNLLALS